MDAERPSEKDLPTSATDDPQSTRQTPAAVEPPPLSAVPEPVASPGRAAPASEPTLPLELPAGPKVFVIMDAPRKPRPAPVPSPEPVPAPVPAPAPVPVPAPAPVTAPDPSPEADTSPAANASPAIELEVESRTASEVAPAPVGPSTEPPAASAGDAPSSAQLAERNQTPLASEPPAPIAEPVAKADPAATPFDVPPALYNSVRTADSPSPMDQNSWPAPPIQQLERALWAPAIQAAQPNGPGRTIVPALEQPSWRLRLLAVLLLTLAFWVGWSTLSSVPALGPEAPPAAFSASRALPHISALARQSRAPGLPGHGEAIAYLEKTLRDMGLQVEAQQEYAGSQVGDRITVSPVYNILATIPGKGPTDGIGREQVLLVAHYDSVATGPGAADDAAGVGALLETIRALLAGPPLQRSVTVLFTDGEETGLLGAKTFRQLHPLARHVVAMINLDARGTRGGALLFETAGGELSLMERVAQSVDHPVSNSLLTHLYPLLPNLTDASVMRGSIEDNGPILLNFAFGEGLLYYHTDHDRVEHLSLDSVQSLGESALSAARALGNGPLPHLTGPRAFWFNPLPGLLLVLPLEYVWPISGLAGLFLLLAWRQAIARRRAGVIDTLGSLFRSMLLLSLLVAGLTIFENRFLLATDQLQIVGQQGDFWHSGRFLVGVSLLMLAALWSGERLFGARTPLASRYLSGQVLVGLLLGGTLLFSPPATYIFAFPLACTGLALTIGLWRTPPIPVLLPVMGPHGMEETLPPAPDSTPRALTIAMVLGGMSQLLILSPVLRLVYHMMGTQMLPILLAIIGLIFVGLLPLLMTLCLPFRRLPALLIAGAGLAVLVQLSQMPGFDEQHPRPTSLFWVQEGDSETASWISLDEKPSAYNEPLLGKSHQARMASEFLPGLEAQVLASNSTLRPYNAPRLERLEDSSAVEVRTLRLLLSPGQKSRMLMVSIAAETSLLHWTITDARLPRPFEIVPRAERPMQLEVYNPPLDGLQMELEVPSSELVRITLVERVGELTDLPAPPPGEMRMPFPQNGGRFVTRTVSF